MELTRLGWWRCWGVLNEWQPEKVVGGVEGSRERSMMCWAVENKDWQQQQVSEWAEVNVELA